MADRPTTKFTDAARLPKYLQEHGRFCVWKYENRDGKRWTKVPYQPKATQYGAASTNPAHFTDIHTALDHAEGFDGLGLGIFGDIAAIDIDHCISSNGELSQLAQTVIETMDSYTEYSPSGKGIRILFRAAGVKHDTNAYYINNQNARDPRQEWPEKQGLEVYIAGATSKYVTVTGNAIRAVEVKDRSAQIQQILDRYMKKATAERPAAAPAPSMLTLSDREILDKAIHAANGALFDRLYYGGDIGGHASHSEADLALMNLLAYWTNRDAARMIQLFKASALYRTKKEKSGGDKYLMTTAEKAIEGCNITYAEQRAQKTEAATVRAAAPQEEPQETAAITTAQAVDAFLEKAQSRAFEPIPTGYKSIDLAIGGGFIRQTIVLLGAAPGAGKTIFAQQVCENIAKEGKANVVYYNLEMSAEQLIARSLSRDTEYSALQILQGYKWTPQQAPVIMEAAERYKKTIAPKIKYNPCASADYEDIYNSMEREAAALEESGDTLPLVVVVDYLQLIQGENKDAVETIKAAVMAFKDFAIKHNAVVFLIMAHSRATNESGEVKQGAGRDTSAIEYSADLQLSLNYADKEGAVLTAKGLDEMYSRVSQLNSSGQLNEAANEMSYRRLTVTKNRFGQERSSARLRFFGESSKFVEMIPKSREADSENWDLPFDPPNKPKPKRI